MSSVGSITRFTPTRALVLGMAILMITVFSGCGDATVDPFGAKVGDRAPDFSLPTPDNAGVTLSDYQGTPVMVYFWATWCGSCTFDLPDINAAAEETDDADLKVITVNIGEQTEKVQEFVLETVPDYSFTVATDPDADTFRDYRVLSIPITFFIDADGIIRHIKAGRVSRKNIDEGVARLG